MALTDYAVALCALLGTLLVPFVVMIQMLRLKRRAIRVAAHPTALRGTRR